MKASRLIVVGVALSSVLLASCQTNQPQRRAGGGGGAPDRKTMFVRLDVNGDGVITRQEFMAGPNAQRNPQQAPQVFRRMDRDGSGTLSRKEFVAGPQG
jgi:hypothetical protein